LNYEKHERSRLSLLAADERFIGIGIPGAFRKSMDSPVMTNEFHLVVDARQSRTADINRVTGIGWNSGNSRG